MRWRQARKIGEKQNDGTKMEIWELLMASRWRHLKAVSQLDFYDLQSISNQPGLLVLSSSACIYYRYDFGRRSSYMSVRGMYNADNTKRTGIARMTGYTRLQYGNAIWRELLWFVRHHPVIKMIRKQVASDLLIEWFCSFINLRISGTQTCHFSVQAKNAWQNNGKRKGYKDSVCRIFSRRFKEWLRFS